MDSWLDSGNKPLLLGFGENNPVATVEPLKSKQGFSIHAPHEARNPLSDRMGDINLTPDVGHADCLLPA